MTGSSGSDDIESQFEEEQLALKPKGGWSRGTKIAVFIAVVSAVLLAIAIPVAVKTGGGGGGGSGASSTSNLGDTNGGVNWGVGTDGSNSADNVDVVTNDPIDSVAPPQTQGETTPTNTNTQSQPQGTNTNTQTPPQQQEQANTPAAPTPKPTVGPTSAPVPLVPIATATACALVNKTNVTSWIEISDKIIGEAANDLSGRNIALSADGSILAIAAALNSDKGQRTGHVRVYRYDDSGKVSQMGQDLDGENDFDWFGTSLALDASGLRLAVGGRFHDGTQGNDTGHVRLFDFDIIAGNWQQVGSDLQGEAAGDQFGRSVALSADGRRLAVGASNADATVNITNVGIVYMFDISGSSFEPIGMFTGDTKDDLSGGSISLSEDGMQVAIAARMYDAPNGIPDIGQVKVYGYNKESKDWSKVGNNIEGRVAGAQAGVTVALSSDGQRIAVSYPQYIMGIPSPGITKIYELKNGLWEKLGSNDLIGGTSLSISRSGRVAVGDYLGFKEGLNSGFVHVYEYNQEVNAWDLVGQVINGFRGEMSGAAVALSADGTRVAISSPRISPDGLEDAGGVSVYDLCDP